MLAVAVAAAAVGAANRTIGGNATAPLRRAPLHIEDCTPASAPVANVRWTCHPSCTEVNAGEKVTISGSGDLLESLTRPTYEGVIRYLGLPVMSRNGVACGTERVELPLDMGVVDIKMLDCPVEPCSRDAPCSISLDNAMEVALIPPGKIDTDIKTFTDSGADALCIKIVVG